MTITLDLKPNIEATAKAEAQARGLAVEDYLQTFLEQTLPISAKEDTEAVRQQRIAVLERLHGKYAGLPGGGSEEFAAQKEEEKAREERFWQDEL